MGELVKEYREALDRIIAFERSNPGPPESIVSIRERERYLHRELDAAVRALIAEGARRARSEPDSLNVRIADAVLPLAEEQTP